MQQGSTAQRFYKNPYDYGSGKAAFPRYHVTALLSFLKILTPFVAYPPRSECKFWRKCSICPPRASETSQHMLKMISASFRNVITLAQNVFREFPKSLNTRSKGSPWPSSQHVLSLTVKHVRNVMERCESCNSRLKLTFEELLRHWQDSHKPDCPHGWKLMGFKPDERGATQ
jgi:hypothetical protein